MVSRVENVGNMRMYSRMIEQYNNAKMLDFYKTLKKVIIPYKLVNVEMRE